MNLNTDDLLTWVTGTAGVGFLVRFAITALKKQGLADATLDSHAMALANAQKEAKKWEDKYDAEVKNHSDCRLLYEATLKLLGAVENQNKMMRMILIQRGMTGDEIDKALEIDHVD